MSPLMNSNVATHEPEIATWSNSQYPWTQEDRNALLRYARQRLSDADAAEDVVQDTMAAVFVSESHYRGRSKRLTWAFGILKHKIADYQRANYRDRARRADICTADDNSTEGRRMPGQGFDGIDNDNPAAQCERAEFWNVLKAGVDRLPPKTAEVFQRSLIRNDSSSEICHALNISPSNYWVMLHRARTQLRKYLTENWSVPLTLN